MSLYPAVSLTLLECTPGTEPVLCQLAIIQKPTFQFLPLHYACKQPNVLSKYIGPYHEAQQAVM